MKMSKFRIAVLLLLTITVIYAMFVVWSFIEYNTYISTLIARYEALGINFDFVTPFKYIDFWYGEVALWIGIGLTVSWVFIASSKKKRAALTCDGDSSAFSWLKRRKWKLALIFLMIVVVLPLTIVKAQEPICVNGLIYFDEECSDEYRRSRYWEAFFEYDHASRWRPATRFKDNWNIEFVGLNDHNCFWDSDDSETNEVKLLQEAIRKLGGVYDDEEDWWVWEPKDYAIDEHTYALAELLIIVTGQNMEIRGLSPPTWNAMIIRFDAMNNVELHEMSHQFQCLHCSNFCVMNPTYIDLMWNWCGDCFNFIMNHREKWGYKQWLDIVDCSRDGHTVPEDGFIYQRVRGESVIVTATADCGLIFNCWLLDGVPYIDNPITVTIDSDHTLKAYFRFSGGGGGGGGRPPNPRSGEVT